LLQETSYLDWNNSIEILNKAHDADLFVLIIGPKGTGKTTLVRDFAKRKSKKLVSINFSLRTRESHLVGTKTLTDGSVGFDEGILIKSMKEGSMLYLDEINSSEADVLLRLDEALDDRRQIVLKESAGEVINANKDWFVVATINPLTHVGTKELPPQILSRFPVRIRLEYPPVKLSVTMPLPASTLTAINEVFPAIQTSNDLPLDPCRALLSSSGICCVANSWLTVLAFGTEILLLSMPRDFAITSIPSSRGVYWA